MKTNCLYPVRKRRKVGEKDWHVEERSYGSFCRSMSQPFEPEDGAVDAHFDKGVLRLTIKKPAKATEATKTINIKTGALLNSIRSPRLTRAA